jgi:hypothetical protein
MKLQGLLAQNYVRVLEILSFCVLLVIYGLLSNPPLSLLLISAGAFLICFEIPPLIEKVDDSDLTKTIWLPAIFVFISICGAFLSWMLTPAIVYATPGTITSSSQNANCFYGVLKLNPDSWLSCYGLIFTAFHESVFFIPWLFGLLGILARMGAVRAEEKTSKEYKKFIESLFAKRSK